MTTNKINVTNVDFSAGSSVSTGASVTVGTWSYGAGVQCSSGFLVYSPTCIIWMGDNNTSGIYYTRIFRCTDKDTYTGWTAIDLPVAAKWQYGGYGNGKIILIGYHYDGTTNRTKIIHSTDDGLTWGTGTSQTASLDNVTSPSVPIYDGSKWVLALVPISSGTGQLYTSTNAITWTATGSLPAATTLTGAFKLAYNSNINKYLLCNGSASAYISTDSSATAWTSLVSTFNTGFNAFVQAYTEHVFSTGNYFVVSYRHNYPNTFYSVYISSDGVNWETKFLDASGSQYNSFSYYSNKIKDLGNGVVLIDNRDQVNAMIGNHTIYTNIITATNTYSYGDNLGVNNTQLFNTNPNYMLINSLYTGTLLRVPINVGKLNGDRYVDITASKTGATSVTKRLYIRKSTIQQPVYALLANPGGYTLTATADGVVDPASYPSATGQLTVTKDGVDQTGWTFGISNDTGLGASITGNTYSVTSLSNSVDLAYSHISATKTGEPGLLMNIPVNKNKTGGFSGIHRGGTLSTLSTNSSTTISIKFAASGAFQVKYGTGSYTTVVAWVSPINTVSPPGGSWWLMVNTTGEALTSGTTGSWLSLSTDREFVFTRTTPSGTYTCNLQVYFGTTSTGGNISMSTGTLQIIVP